MSDYAGRSPQGENLLRTIHFDRPQWTPVLIGALPAAWAKYGAALDDLMLAHPRLFPSHEKPARRAVEFTGLHAVGRVTDCWGCVWENLHAGTIGQVTGHPLADWSAFETWRPPDPLRDGLLEPRDWNAVARDIAAKKERGDFGPDGALSHGFHYLLLIDLRGFQNVMLDMITGEPMLDQLIEVIIDYNHAAVRKVLDLGSEFLGLAEDLGNQNSIPIGLELWRKYVKPGYEATAGQARDRGLPVFLHCDGHILPLLDDLYETGVRVINPQLRANGLPGLRDATRGKMTVALDLDRQLLPFATPAQVRAHVHEAHDFLHRPEGGLILSAEINEDIPLENIDALFGALEDACRLPDPETTGHAPVGW